MRRKPRWARESRCDFRKAGRWLPVVVFLALAAGCDRFTDAATRLAYDMEAGAGVLGKEEGARYIDIERRGGRTVITDIR